MINTIAGAFNGGTAGGQIQRAAGAEQTIKHSRTGEAGIEQHCSSQGDAGSQQRSTRRQLPGPGDHRQQIGVAAGGVGAPGQMPAGISTTKVQAQHQEPGLLQGKAHATKTFTGTGPTQPMQEQHHSYGGSLRLINECKQFACRSSTTGKSWDRDPQGPTFIRG